MYNFPGLDEKTKRKYTQIIRRFEIPDAKLNFQPQDQYDFIHFRKPLKPKHKKKEMYQINKDEIYEDMPSSRREREGHSRASSSSSSRSEALKELFRKPVKGDINEYIDFGSVKRKPKDYGKKASVPVSEQKMFPKVDSWLLKNIKKSTEKIQNHIAENSDLNSMSVYNLSK